MVHRRAANPGKPDMYAEREGLKREVVADVAACKAIMVMEAVRPGIRLDVGRFRSSRSFPRQTIARLEGSGTKGLATEVQLGVGTGPCHRLSPMRSAQVAGFTRSDVERGTWSQSSAVVGIVSPDEVVVPVVDTMVLAAVVSVGPVVRGAGEGRQARHWLFADRAKFDPMEDVESGSSVLPSGKTVFVLLEFESKGTLSFEPAPASPCQHDRGSWSSPAP